ncbi:MAG: SCO family protein [Acidimicrobiales bacterium]
MTGTCDAYRESWSACLDEEGPDPGPPHCTECADWAERARSLHQGVTALAGRPAPDLTDRLLGAITASGPPGRPRSWRTTVTAAAAAAVVAAVLVGGATVLAGHHAGPPAQVSQVAGPSGQNPNYPGLVQSPAAYPEPDVTLTDTSGQALNLPAISRNRITLVYFGYTHCPDVCPTDMALNAAALSELPASVARQVQVVFVTTDPNRDSPSVIRQWLDHFNPSFIGLTGPVSVIHQAESELDMPLSYLKRDNSGNNANSGGYQVVHAGYTLIFTPDGKAHLFYESTARPSEVAAALAKLARQGFQAAA